MDRDTLENRASLIDLESGRVTNEKGNRQTQNLENIPISEEGSNTYLEVIIRGENDEESKSSLVEKKYKKANNKKASKPPRPPKGPSLCAADMMLVKEISTHAMNRRVRIERIKALRKMREEKSSPSSCNSSICAMIFTVLFVLVICFQGFFSKSVNNGNFHGSPEPATESFISVQLFNHPSVNGESRVGSSSSPEEQKFGSNFQGKDRSAVV